MAAAPTNVVHLLAAAARRTPDRVAIAMSGNRSAASQITFGELWQRVDRAGCGLAATGIAPSDRVVMMIPMSVDLYVALLAVLKIGAAAVFVDPWIRRQQIARFAAFAEPKAFVGIGKAHLLRLIDARLRKIPIHVTTGNRYGGLLAKYQFGHLSQHPGDGSIASVDASDPALITFTTGSSGEPKGANRTHSYLLSQHAALQAEFPYQDDDVDLTMFPVFALNNLAQGITTIVPPIDFRKVAAADGRELLGQLTSESVTTITASPPLIDRLADATQTGNVPSSLRRILVGGAPVSDGQLKRWQRQLPDVELVVVYGSTEAEPVAHITADDRLQIAKTGSPGYGGFCTGRPTPLLKSKVIRIVDEPVTLRDGTWTEWEVAAGEVGELVVAGDHVGRDYFRNPAAVAANKIVDHDGCVWHRMGDTGYFDPQGRFWLVGRVHSTIRRKGVIIHPQLVEQAAAGDEVLHVAALAVKDELLGQRLVVVVESTAADKATAEAIAQRLRRSKTTFDELVVTTSPLPVDPRHNSKIDYGRLRSMLAARGSGRAWARWPSSDLLSSLARDST